MPAATTADAGRMIGRRYRLRSAVGRGGMGTVWLAEDELLGRAVAVKEVHLPPGLPERDREELRHRLLREARVAARLDHPSAVTVYDVVEEDGWPYIVMEFVRASTLDKVIRDEGPLPPARVAAVGLDVLGALEAAHAAGIVHRDVKPANILIRDDGRTTLTDFGIATSSGESGLTSTGLLLGSPSYIAPERARGRVPGPSSDLWSLGATLYTAVEGHAPFERGEPFLTLAAITSEDHAPFNRAGPLAEVIDGLLAREPADRLDAPAARALLRAVAAAVAVPPTATPEAAPTVTREPGARSMALPWSEVIAAAESDPPLPAAADPAPAGAVAAAAVVAVAGAGVDGSSAMVPEVDESSAVVAGVDGSSAVVAGVDGSSAVVAGVDGSPGAVDAVVAAGAAAVAGAGAAERSPAADDEAVVRPAPAERDVRPAALPPSPPREVAQRRAPVLVPVRASQAHGSGVAEVTPGTLPPAGPRRGRGLGLVLGLLVLLLAGYGVGRLLDGGTAAGDDDVAATDAAAATTPPDPASATPDPQVVAPEPGTDAAAGDDDAAEDASGQGSGEDSSGPGSAEDSSGPGSGEDSSGQGSGDAAAAPPPQPTAQEAPAPAQTAVPDTFAAYTSPEHGWTVRHPPGWQPVRRSATATDLREPGGTGSYLRIDTTSTPGESALGDWQRYETNFDPAHTNYQRIRMEEVDYLDYADAADWEYTYEDGITLHAINRGFVLNDRSAAFALNFQTREPDWAGSRELFDQMAASFQP